MNSLSCSGVVSDCVTNDSTRFLYFIYRRLSAPEADVVEPDVVHEEELEEVLREVPLDSEAVPPSQRCPLLGL